MSDHQPVIEKCQLAFVTAQKKLRHLITTCPNYFPMYTRGGKWQHEGEAWTNWCEGFLGGQLWLIYLYCGEDWWREQAQHYSQLLEHRATDRQVHDLGFLFWHTWKRWYDLEGNPRQRAVVIQAGQTMGRRFQPRGRYLSSFVAPESSFIDIMMNVGIIFYAAQETADSALLDVARQHCLTTRRYLVRGDGSVAHEGLFNLETGAFLRQSTHQGWRDDSSWARGLAWAIYGFGTAYSWTRDDRFLRTARQCADYYMLNTPSHGICPNDWLEPHPARPFESSAAAITAAALLNLADLVSEPLAGKAYRDYALRIMDTLTADEFLASHDREWEGLLKHGAYHERKGLGVDESVIWGDYFFLEAAAKLLNLV